MNRPHTPLAPAITGLSFIFLLGCTAHQGTSDPTKVEKEIAEFRNQELELVRDTILEPVRAEQIILLLGERDRLIAHHAGEISAYRQQLSALNADYDAERESFETLMLSYNEQRAAAQQAFVDLIAELKQKTTAEEWKVISRFQLKRLHPRKLIYGQAAAGD